MKAILQIASAAIISSGLAIAQSGAPTPNAIGIWNSSTYGFTAWFIGTGYPSGPPFPNDMMWQALPPELTTYFRNNSTCVRELDFRGVEVSVAHFGFGATTPLNSPNFQVRNSIPYNVPSAAGVVRWTPGNTIYANLASIPGAINTALIPIGAIIRISMILSTPAVVPVATGGAGEAVMGVWNNFTATTPGVLQSLSVVSTQSEPTTGASSASPITPAVSLSGGTAYTGQVFLLPTGNIFGFGVISGEYCWTWFFEQSMVQMVVNSEVTSSSGQILGGGAPPISFAFRQNDGRESLYQRAGDTVSYSGNSTYGNPGPIGTVWFAPFVQFSGDVGAPGATDPPPEIWADGPMYIYCSPLQGYIDDLCLLTSGCIPGTGAALNPANSRHGLWLGVDLGNNLFNPLLLVNGLVFADVSSGFQWAGPASKTYNSVSNPAGLFARNLTNLSGYYDANGTAIVGLMEQRTLLVGPQSGYTPFALAPGSLQFYGFGTYMGGLAGTTFSMQAWMLDTVSGQIVDVTNVATARLQ
ncbi:MAG: hypothetical protein HY286_06000 [Planctomycetes bacterium]|nr:hypothetical protein [Planctomycetota bacterium]